MLANDRAMGAAGGHQGIEGLGRLAVQVRQGRRQERRGGHDETVETGEPPMNDADQGAAATLQPDNAIGRHLQPAGDPGRHPGVHAGALGEEPLAPDDGDQVGRRVGAERLRHLPGFGDIDRDDGHPRRRQGLKRTLHGAGHAGLQFLEKEACRPA